VWKAKCLFFSAVIETRWDYVSVELLPTKGPLSNLQDCTWMNIEHKWNDNDRKKPNNLEENLSQCHTVHHISHKDCPGTEYEILRRKACTNRLSYGTVMFIFYVIYQPFVRLIKFEERFYPDFYARNCLSLRNWNSINTTALSLESNY
jgi:hypothetical protein